MSEEQATCGDCGSEMTHVRPGKWQCDVCESRDFVRKEQAKALRWAAARLSWETSMGSKVVATSDLEEKADLIECGKIEVTL